MVALFRFFKFFYVSVELRFSRERQPVNTGEHFVVFVAAPVCARQRRQRERPDFARGRQVRTFAHIGKSALLIKRNVGFGRKTFDKSHLVAFVKAFHKLNRVFAFKFEPLYGQIAFYNFLHFAFYKRKIANRNGIFKFHVAIKTRGRGHCRGY